MLTRYLGAAARPNSATCAAKSGRPVAVRCGRSGDWSPEQKKLLTENWTIHCLCKNASTASHNCAIICSRPINVTTLNASSALRATLEPDSHAKCVERIIGDLFCDALVVISKCVRPVGGIVCNHVFMTQDCALYCELYYMHPQCVTALGGRPLQRLV